MGLLDLIGINLNSSFRYRMNLGDGQLSDWVAMTGSTDVFNKLKKGFVPIRREPDTGGFGELYDENRLAPAFVFDYNQDGQPDMLIPHDRVVSFWLRPQCRHQFVPGYSAR